MSKSGKLRLAAKLIGIIGCVACLIGGAAYCVLTLPEIVNIPFEMIYVIIDGAAFVVFLAVSIILSLVARSIDRREKRAEEVALAAEPAEAEALAAAEQAEAEAKALALSEAEAAFVPENECCIDCDFAETCDYLADEKARFIEAALAGDSEEEDDEDVEEVVVVKRCCPMMAQAQAEAKSCDKLVADAREAIDKAITAVKENATKIVIPVAAACATALMIANAKKNKKRKTELKRMQAQAKFRQDFFKWLG